MRRETKKGPTGKGANEEMTEATEELWRESERKDRERRRRRHAAEWFCYWSALASSLRLSAEEYDRRAEALLEEPAGEGG